MGSNGDLTVYPMNCDDYLFQVTESVSKTNRSLIVHKPIAYKKVRRTEQMPRESHTKIDSGLAALKDKSLASILQIKSQGSIS